MTKLFNFLKKSRKSPDEKDLKIQELEKKIEDLHEYYLTNTAKMHSILKCILIKNNSLIEIDESFLDSVIELKDFFCRFELKNNKVIITLKKNEEKKC